MRVTLIRPGYVYMLVWCIKIMKRKQKCSASSTVVEDIPHSHLSGHRNSAKNQTGNGKQNLANYALAIHKQSWVPRAKYFICQLRVNRLWIYSVQKKNKLKYAIKKAHNANRNHCTELSTLLQRAAEEWITISRSECQQGNLHVNKSCMR